MGAPGQHQDQS
jgi:DNA replication licensing factor MCM4